MADLSTKPTDAPAEALAADLLAAGDGISVGAWFGAYAVALGVAIAALAIMLHGHGWTWTWSPARIGEQMQGMDAGAKLLIFGVYVSLCCTFLPMPTNAIVAAVATHEAAVTGELWTTVLAVGLVGAIGSTIANLNDYHLFTLALRHHHVKRIRHTRLYDASARWFSRSPFAILVIFNIIPIPVDLIRMLAVTTRYPRRAFAAANFVGRLLRYSVIAFVTFHWDLGWIAVVVLLGLAVTLALAKLFPPAVRKILGRTPTIADGDT